MPTEFFATVILVLLLLDPLGNVPVLIALLKPWSAARQRVIVLRECAIALVILLAFVYLGDRILSWLHLTPSALEISGGFILFLIALGMVFPRHAPHDEALTGADEGAPVEPLIVPIAIPMIAGPAALATVMLTARQSEQPGWLALAVVLAMLINAVILLASNPIARLFGRAGIAALERLMGLLLTALSVQMLVSGIKQAFALGPAA